MSMYSIVKLSNGNYECNCYIQDGLEHWVLTLEEEAIRSLIDAAKIMNGVKITKEDIRFEDQVDPVPVVSSSLCDPVEAVIRKVRAEYQRAVSLHGSFSSTHEGYAIIKEEVDELWDGVKMNDDRKLLEEEAIQIAAMAIRFCIDIV